MDWTETSRRTKRSQHLSHLSISRVVPNVVPRRVRSFRRASGSRLCVCWAALAQCGVKFQKAELQLFADRGGATQHRWRRSRNQDRAERTRSAPSSTYSRSIVRTGCVLGFSQACSNSLPKRSMIRSAMASSSILIPVFIIAVVRSASHEAMTGRPLSGIAS